MHIGLPCDGRASAVAQILTRDLEAVLGSGYRSWELAKGLGVSDMGCGAEPRSALIGDIKAGPLLFYDPEFEEDGFQFCEQRDIDALPGVDGSRELWLRNEAGFACQAMDDERLVDASTYCFDASLLDRFRNVDVLFVERGTELIGAVHPSDYNHPAVASHLYDLVSCYERALRNLAGRMELSEDSVIAMLQESESAAGREWANRYRNWRMRSPAAPEFHVINLSHLQAVVNSRARIRLDIDSVLSIRNATMHSKELVNRVDRDALDFVYDFQTFEHLFDAVQILRRDLRRIINRSHILGGLSGIGQPR